MAKNPDPSQVSGLCEINLPWNDDFSLDETGDLLIAYDTVASAQSSFNPEATTQRLVRLVLSCPGGSDVNGNPLGQADDIFHPLWGAGARAYVGDTISSDDLAILKGNIAAQLLQDPSVASTPPPQIDLYFVELYVYQLKILWYGWNGVQYALPTIQLTPKGVQILPEAA